MAIEENNQLDPHKLEEGQEVSLNLPEPAHRVDDEVATIHNSVPSATNMQFPDGHNVSREPIKIEAKPRINLSPQNLPPTNNALPLNEKQQKALTKLQKLRKHKHWYNIKLVIGTVLAFLLIFYSQFFISQIIYVFNRPSTDTGQTEQPTNQTPAQPVEPTQPQQQAEVVGPQNEIIIPKIGVRAPLVFIDTTNEFDVLKALRDGVVHYYGTAYPGESGNSVFFGHSSNDWWEQGNYKFVFVLLEKLVPGDTYEIHYNSRKYVYTVAETKVVEPTDLSVLNQTAEPTSTLITCTPPGTSWRRFVVHAKQTSPAPSISPQQSAQQASQQSNTLPATATLPSAPPSIWDQIINFFRNLFSGNQQQPTQQPAQTAPQHLPEVN